VVRGVVGIGSIIGGIARARRRAMAVGRVVAGCASSGDSALSGCGDTGVLPQHVTE